MGFYPFHCLQVVGVSTSPDVTPQPILLQGPAGVYGLNITGGFGAGSAVELVVVLQGNVATEQVRQDECCMPRLT